MRGLLIATLATALPLAAIAQQEGDSATPEAAPPPETSPAPAPRPDPEDRADEVAPDAPDAGPAPDAETAADADADPAETAPQWEVLREDPEDLAACLADLDSLGTVYETLDPLGGELRDCGIANPVEVAEILPGVALRPDAVMRCETARALAEWVSVTVAPAARLAGDYGDLSAIDHGSTYVCRARGGVASGKLSEHAFGNAIDVMGFRFEGGGALAVEPRADTATIEEAFQRAARGGACLSFTTVLGPGTNAAHADHLHLDVKARNGGYRICQ
ncbi:extensin [Palleronia sediminis]|uniref:Extensin n=1 Tax=Palleronia sediminis TaxID=2547833 RepID=A0A4R6A7F2_9RHOB|nr:extensin family protein [Palleronia sediminis]TDL78108.1 extensin [Palleronia sediminis]